MPNGGSGDPAGTGNPSQPTVSQPNQIVMSNDQFRELLDALRLNTRHISQEASADVTSQQPVHVQGASTQQVGSFVNCTHRFNGSTSADLEAFINCIQVYKDCANVSNANALRGFAILLTDLAATWWNGIKQEVTSFDDAIAKLRAAFGRKKPAYKIYREIFSNEQHETEPTDIFICKVRALFAQLPPDTLKEETQIDMIFGLLSIKIRKHISRDTIKTFDQLLQKAREIEISIQEEEKTEERASQMRDHDVSFPAKRHEKPKCAYCKKFGHSKDECRKLKSNANTRDAQPSRQNEDMSKREVSEKKPTFSCYGCGTPGVIKSNCEKCKNNSTSTAQTSAQSIDIFSFTSVEKQYSVRPRERPMLLVKIGKFEGYGLIDVAAKQSIAGYRLYQKLKSINQEFHSTEMKIILADGVEQTKEILYTTINVTIKDRNVPTTFVVLPEATQNRTLLGIDFIEDAKITVDAADRKWYFSDDEQHRFELAFEDSFDKSGETKERKVFSIETLREDEGTSLNADQKKELNELIDEYKEIFGRSEEPTPFAEHKINTNSATPIATPPYQMTSQKKEILKMEIDKMLEEDVIEPCESAWASPVVLVPKTDGSWRVCIDYRKINAITVSDKYPLPRIDEMLHLAKQTLYMTTIDLRSGYWQIAVRESDRDKTCFTSPFGTFRFKRMPFGLKNSGATFQRLVDRFRSGLNDVTVFAYLDDLIIVSPTFEKHIDDLKKIFERLKLFKLRAKRSKCCFARESVAYLGHVITRDGISVNPDKVAAIRDMSPPKNVKQVKSFIQACSWFRRFIPNFAEMARPLTNLLKKNSVWQWSHGQQSAFESLKQALTTAPVLRQADDKLPYKIKTDASGYALGAVLLQGEGEDERPVEYASRLLSPSEKNYDTTQREALALVWACKKFRGYIEGNEVVVCSDHQPLKWLMSLQSPTGRLARWALSLQSYNLKINYIPGKSNQIADILSRPDDEKAESVDFCPISVEFPHLSCRDLREQQLQDPEIVKIIESFEKNNEVNLANWLDRGYVMNNGVLYRFNPDMDSENAQFVVPKQERAQILRENHDSADAGHYGTEKTIQKISSRYYWPGMRQDITQHVKGCLECQRYKADNQKPAGLLRTPAAAQRFEIIAVDLFGPLPQAPDGQRWILIVEDIASKWVEIFPLVEATAVACARTLIDEIFFRYGFPRKMISDNGTQFVSDIMQYVADCFDVKQSLIPVYYPEANPVERKNRDLKTQLAIQVGNYHDRWVDKLPSIRFAMNSTKTSTTGFSPAYITFARELRTPGEVRRDFREIVQNHNFVPEITPYLLTISEVMQEVKDCLERSQDRTKRQADENRRDHPDLPEGSLVLVKTHALSSSSAQKTSKFYPKRDGPYVITKKASPVSYEIALPENPQIPLGKYHVSDLTLYQTRTRQEVPDPVRPIRRRGRPRKSSQPSSCGSGSVEPARSTGGGCNAPTIKTGLRGGGVRRSARLLQEGIRGQ